MHLTDMSKLGQFPPPATTARDLDLGIVLFDEGHRTVGKAVVDDNRVKILKILIG